LLNKKEFKSILKEVMLRILRGSLLIGVGEKNEKMKQNHLNHNK